MKIISYNMSYFASELEIFDPWTTLMFLIGLGAHSYLLITFRHPQFGRGVMARSGNGLHQDFAQDVIFGHCQLISLCSFGLFGFWKLFRFELTNFFYDSLKLRFGDYENLLALDLFGFAIYLDTRFWLMDAQF